MEARLLSLVRRPQQILPKTAVFGVLCLWFAFAVTLSLSGVLPDVSSPALLLVGSGIPVSGYFALYFGSIRFRCFLLGLNLRSITLAQLLRLFGALSLIAYHQNRLPALFVFPTAITDITAAITAPIVAQTLISKQDMPRAGLGYWHVFAMLAALSSATLGILTSGTKLGFLAGGITSQDITVFPFSLSPLFVAPLTLILHLIALAIMMHRSGPLSQASS